MNNEKVCDTTLIANGLRDILNGTKTYPADYFLQSLTAAIELVDRVPGYLQQIEAHKSNHDANLRFISQLLDAAGIDGQDSDDAPKILASQMKQLQEQANQLHAIGHAVGLLGGQNVSLAVDKVRELVAEHETLNARIMHIRDQLGINYASVGDVRLEADKIGMLCAERDNLEGIVKKLRKRSGETPENRAETAPALTLEMLARAIDIIDRLTMPTFSCEPAGNPALDIREWEGPRHG